MTRQLALAMSSLLIPALLSAQTSSPLPRKHAPQPTVAAITAGDLMSRLYQFADDSMMGREATTVGNVKATDYIASQVKKMGLVPAGDEGTYFQTVNVVVDELDTAAITIEGHALARGRDYVAIPPGLVGSGRELTGSAIPVMYGGALDDTTVRLGAGQLEGKLVVVSPPTRSRGAAAWQFWRWRGMERYADARAIAVVTLDSTPPDMVDAISNSRPSLDLGEAEPKEQAMLLSLSGDAAQRLMGAPLAGLAPGASGSTVKANIMFREHPVRHPARNVVAILPGRDPVLRHQYVAIGAHNDHVGMAAAPLDHDSVRVFNRHVRPWGANQRNARPTPEQLDTIRAELDSIRKIRPVRMDSVFNGADDDGSGSMAVLEIAEQLSSRKGNEVPRRSVLFVWHTGEEKGLWGSRWFTENPTVPLDSVVAQINIDMLGRGRAEDMEGGGPDYIETIGSRRRSTEFGDLIDSIATHRPQKMRIDYIFDSPDNPMHRYCRSDHYNYARKGIPIAFISTGYERDYHMVTDEPQYIDYEHMVRSAGFIEDVLLAVANRDNRLELDHPKPDPNVRCR